MNDRGSTPEQIEEAVNVVEEAFKYFKNKGNKLQKANIKDFEDYISKLIKRGENTEKTLVSLARYMYFLDMKDVWIYFASILGGRNILPSISERLEEIVGVDVRDKVFSKVKAPTLGSKPSAYIESTCNLMEQLEKHLSPSVYRKVLAGNHHKVPVENFEKHKRWLDEEGNIDAWLQRMHREAVEDLEQHLREGKVWYEQIISPEIVEFVKKNQEILSGVRKGEWIYNTKFPYSPDEYLNERDPLMRRYYMCHCPMAREAIIKDEPEIPMEWCYCSAGYGKLRYDVAFDTDTEVEVLESVFSGSDKCRFRIKIPKDVLNKYAN